MLKEAVLDAFQDEQIIDEIKKRIVDKIVQEVHWHLGTDYVGKLAEEIAETITKDEKFLEEVEKIKEKFRQRIIEQVITGLNEALNKLTVEISTWRLNEGLQKAVSLHFED